MEPTPRSPVTGILISLYVAEAAFVLILLGVYKAPALDAGLLCTKAGVALAAGGIGFAAGSWLIVRRIAMAGPIRGRAVSLAVSVNLFSVVLACLLAEGAVRAMASNTPAGIVVGTVRIRPTWRELVQRSREALATVGPARDGAESYFVHDPDLGWTVGPGRRSQDGLYSSSVEGIRSASPGLRLADVSSRFRVALVGDSNAFSLEVPFEESWGYHLQQELGDDVHVLNFGVDGYGFDQMMLRYERDVRSWRPDVVLIGFAQHDLVRAMAVYPFVAFGWPGYLVKPRFTIEHGKLNLLNAPLPGPDEILGAEGIEDLPWIDYDLGYRTSDWSRRFEHGPLAMRVLTSAFPRWREEDPRFSRKTVVDLNGRLLAEIVGLIESDGAVPLVVYMSDPQARSESVSASLALAGVSPVNIANCLSDVPPSDRMVPSGHHFTGLANRAVAHCTASAVDEALPRPGGFSESSVEQLRESPLSNGAKE